MKISHLAAIAAVVLLSSCSTTKDNTLAYFRNIENSKSGEMPSTLADYAVRIQPDDELVITVTSTVPEATAIYNLPLSNPARLSELTYTSQPKQQTYVVDGTGNITDYAEFNACCDPEALAAAVSSGAEIVFAPMHLGRVARLAQKDILERGRGTEFGEMLAEIFRGYKDDAAGEGYVAMYDANAVEALLRPEQYDFIRCTAEVNLTDKPGQTFLRPDENGSCFYLEIRDPAALSEAMLSDLFPG